MSEKPMSDTQIERVWDTLHEVYRERVRQHAKWGEQNHPDGTGGLGREHNANVARERCERAFGEGHGTWLEILAEKVAEAFAESDPEKLRAELVQVAAVAVAWVDKIDRERVAQEARTA